MGTERRYEQLFDSETRIYEKVDYVLAITGSMRRSIKYTVLQGHYLTA